MCKGKERKREDKIRKVYTHRLWVQRWDLTVAISVSVGWSDVGSLDPLGLGEAHAAQSPVGWYYTQAQWECPTPLLEQGVLHR